MIKRFSVLCVMFCMISACALFDTSSNTLQKPNYIKPSNIESGFNISGRFIIQTSSKNTSGNFTWDKSVESENINFRTPLGQTVAQIKINESGIATLYTRDDSYTGDDLADEMEDQFGFTLPLNSLHYWVQGVSIPNVPISENLASGFIQSGWTVEYLDWQTPSHPHILRCINGDYQIKLLIDWL